MEYKYRDMLKRGVIQVAIKEELDEVYRKAEAFDKILHQVDKESNWTTVETPIGITKMLLHTRIGRYTHDVVKRMRSKDERSYKEDSQ